ncbi:hypothetical protein LCGC14_3107360, partial [marine sediment metagenome]
ERITLELDTTGAEAQLKEIDQLRQEVEKEAEEASNRTRHIVIGMAQSTWGVIDAVMSAAGIKLSIGIRAAITGGFAIAHIYEAIHIKESLTPYTAVMGAIGLIQLVSVFASIYAAVAEEAELERSLAAGMQVTNAFAGLARSIGSAYY